MKERNLQLAYELYILRENMKRKDADTLAPVIDKVNEILTQVGVVLEKELE